MLIKSGLKKTHIEDCAPWMIIGILLSLLTLFPFLVLKEKSVITYHDQLDGEVITYILNAKHLLDGTSNYPEIMNGISKNGLASPAPLFVIFYSIFSPFVAFMLSMAIVKVVAFISMFLLIEELTETKALGFAMALMFMLLPFYAVYGLCIPGQPLVYYSLLRLKRSKNPVLLYAIFALYAACSSLALVGFAVLSVLLCVFAVSVITKEKPLRYAFALVITATVYIAENISLVKQLLGLSDNFVSHKSEIARSGIIFFESLKNLILYGANYTEAYQIYYLPIIGLAVMLGGIYLAMTAGAKARLEETYKRLVGSLTVIFVIASISAFFDSKWFVSVANSRAGFIHDFNFDRFSWLLTPLWFVSCALAIKMLFLMADNARFSVAFRIVTFIVVVASVACSSFFAFMKSDLKANVMKILKHGDYYMMTWEQFYATDLFEEVDALIGRDKRDYRVASLGIYPAAASYNGFYCLDAYSNNYNVEYKHEFRDVIAPQLEKSQYLSEWFDNWGNRCYLVICDNMNYFTLEKRWNNYTENYNLDFKKLKRMGCDYIISAEYLVSPESNGLTLLNKEEKPIETEESWYRLFVYEIN